MSVKIFSVAVTFALLAAGGVSAEDAMATNSMSGDAMAPMMSDADLAKCLDEAKMISFPDVAMVAEQACHNMHNGHDAMGGDAMGGAAMATDSKM